MSVNQTVLPTAGAPPVKLVTVHGTGAGDPDSVSGPRWWQLNSAFQKALGERIDLKSDHIEIVPFQWDFGPNSETDRRRAADALLTRLVGYDDAGIDYHLIGHSHGGSVLYNTLLKSVDEDRRLQRLQSWTTIGTPFLDYRKNRFMFQRLTGLGLTIYSTGLIAIVIAMAFWMFGTSAGFDVESYGQVWGLSDAMMQSLRALDLDDLLHQFSVALVVYASLCLIALFLLEQRKRGWFTVAEKRRLEDWYGKNWLGLWHQEDEAISALLNVRHVSGDIIPSTFLAPIVGYIQLVLVGLVGLVLVWDVVIGDGHVLLELALDVGGPSTYWDPELGQFQDTEPVVDWIVFTILLVMVLAVAGASVWLVTLLLRGLARVIGIPVAFVFNKIIWSSVRQRAWGDDLPAEDVWRIAAHPPEFTRATACLPDIVAAPLRDHSDHHAISTLNKVRLMLGMTNGGAVQPDVRAELGETLNWQELIHTSYFEVPAFVDLVALQLGRAGFSTLRDGFATPSTQRHELTDWLDSQSPA